MREEHVDTAVTDEIPEALIRVDGEALRGALINLLRNSMEAMSEGGRINVLLTMTDEGQVAINVSDEGPGISPEISERIFDPFVTTKDRGNGFGLPLALRAVEANGGRLRLSRGGRAPGAHFVMELPASPGHPLDHREAD